MNTFSRLLLWLCLCLPLFAGQSIILPNATTVAFADPTYPVDSDWRAELYLDQWSGGTAGTSIVVELGGIGFRAMTINSQIWLYDLRNTYTGVAAGGTSGLGQCRFEMTGRTGVLLRAQRVDGQLRCEIWSGDGSNRQQQYLNLSAAGTTSTGGILGTTQSNWDTDQHLAFVRVHSSTLPFGSRPPVTADTVDLIRGWRFDGNGTAETGGNDITTTAFAFATTAIGAGAYSLPTQVLKPTWTQWLPIRAGHPNGPGNKGALASNSYSMADSTATVSCFWQQISGPSTLRWESRTACTPTVSGAVFGYYTVRLRVTDTDDRISTADYAMGSVAFDNNGVVIYPDARLDDLLGPQMALGQNPWEAVDERQRNLTLDRANLLKIHGGTVEVPNLKPDLNGTTLTGTVWWDQTSTLRKVYGVGTNFLDGYCGGVAGPGTTNWIVPEVVSPLWGGASGVPRPLYADVLSCVSDTEINVRWRLESEATVLQASPGVDWGLFFGHTGRPDLRSGTVHVANGSTTLTGVDTDLAAAFCNGGSSPVAGASVQIPGAALTITNATNATPIVITTSTAHGWTDGGLRVTILGVGGNTAANNSYFAQVLTSDTLALYGSYSFPSSVHTYTSPIAGNGAYTSGGTLQHPMTSHAIASCTSATVATLSAAYTGLTISAPGGGWVPNRTSDDQGTWSTGGAFTTWFYDPGLAYARAYWNSGDPILRDAYRYMALNQLRTPYASQWMTLYEAPTSTILSAVVEPEIWTAAGMDPWPMLASRVSGVTSVLGNNITDQRDGAYAVWALALLAKYHPDSATRTARRADLVTHYNSQAVPFRLANGGYYSFYNSGQDATRVWTAANGSDLMNLHSGADIDSAYCGTPSNTGGTATVAGAALTGSGTDWVGTANKWIVLMGTLNSEPRLELSRIASSPTPTATAVTLTYPWRGDAGAVTSHIHGTGFPLKVFESVTSANALQVPRRLDLDTMYRCTMESGTQIRLNRAYTGTTTSGDVYRRVQAASEAINFSPWFGQPFMNPLRGNAYYHAAIALDGHDAPTAAGYRSIVAGIADLMYTGRDTRSLGQRYTTDSPLCLPYDDNVATICDGTTDCGVERHYNMEMWTTASRDYLHAPTPTKLARMDEMYRLTWARPGMAAPVAGDGCWADYPGPTGTYAATGGALDKALGQSQGHGGVTEWAGARVGGPAAVVTRPTRRGFVLPAGATDIRYTVTQPNGETSSIVCTTSPCDLSALDRRGRPLLLVEYRDAGANVIRRASERVELK